MATKRMFSKNIVDSDRFYDLPVESQLIYFHLGMNADVKGFVEPKKICRLVGIKIEALKPLISENLIIPFDTGVVVISDWHVNNSLRENRESPSIYLEELEKLSLNKANKYELRDYSGSSTGELQHRLGKVRLGKVRLVKEKNKQKENKNLDTKNSKNYLLNIPEEDIKKFSEDYLANTVQVIEKGEDLYNWCESKGRVYKNYRAFLQGALKRDYGKRYR